MKKISLNVFYWVLPLAIALSSFYFLKNDAIYFLKFYLSLFALGIIFLPLSNLLFKSHNYVSYIFAKPLGMLIASFIAWTLSYLKIVPFKLLYLYLLLFLLAFIFYYNKKLRNSFLVNLKIPNTIRIMALNEALFGSALLFWTFARGLKPLVDSLEKPMNYGFMMSLMRTSYLPASDMWYSQGDINYYYFGQYVYTFITKISNLSVEVSYNLSLASTFALTITLAFAIGFMLVSLAIKKGGRIFSIARVIGGILSSFLVGLAGNSHSFFYATTYDSVRGKDIFAPGYKLMNYLNEKGLLDKFLLNSETLPDLEEASNIKINEFWFANSTRYIGYNPETIDKTIHEFPFYSFLVADLHAHLINLAFVLLFIGLLIVLITNKSIGKITTRIKAGEFSITDSADMSWVAPDFKLSLDAFKRTLLNPFFILMGLVLGVFMMTNFWDFVIYIVVVSMVLLITNMRYTRKLLAIESIPVFVFQTILILIPFMLIQNPAIAILLYLVVSVLCFILLILRKDALTITGAMLSVLFFVSHLLIIPFNMNFDPMSKSIALTVARTPIFQLGILWGTHVLVGVIFLSYVISKRIIKSSSISGGALTSVDKKTFFFSGINLADLFVSGLFVCGVLFLILPEIIYVVDIYSGDFKRANTMFKFTYQAFTMLSLVFAYALARIIFNKDIKSKFSLRWQIAGLFLALLIILPGYYPLPATNQWLGEFSFERYKGINGIENLNDKDRLAAIRWLNTNIKDQPVLLEAYGDSYTEYNQISAYTGLPTVMGWQTHQWLWRTSKTINDAYGQVVRPRQSDVNEIYEGNDASIVSSLIEKYEIEMIVVSNLEREKFPEINEEFIKSLGNIIFESNDLYIMKIN